MCVLVREYMCTSVRTYERICIFVYKCLLYVCTGGRFAAERARLARELNEDAVARAIDQRPSMSELLDANIAENRAVAPVLAKVAKQLEREIIKDTLNQKLYAREDVDQLEKRELIKGMPSSSSSPHARMQLNIHTHTHTSTQCRRRVRHAPLTYMNVCVSTHTGSAVAPRLRAPKAALEHALTRDAVGHLLEMRPEADDLMRSNVLASTPLSHKIAASAKQLAHRMTVDRVGHLLEKRSEIDLLQHANVLKDVRVAPSLQRTQRNLEKNLAKANLYHALKYRPSINDVMSKGILDEDDKYYYVQAQQQYDNDRGQQQQQYNTQQHHYQQYDQNRDYHAFVQHVISTYTHMHTC